MAGGSQTISDVGPIKRPGLCGSTDFAEGIHNEKRANISRSLLIVGFGP